MKHIIAIDIGTQSTRVAVVTQDGVIIGIAQIPHDTDSPKPGWAQQNPAQWWNETCRASKQVLNQTGINIDSIAGVATCGQMHGPVGVDKAGNITTEWVQLWCDKRCSPQAEAIRRNFDESRLMKLTGNGLNPAWPGIKIRWEKENHPKAYQQTRWYLVPKDFINYRLTGVAAADPSEQSGTYVWDCNKEEYSQELAEVIGVDLEKFAPVHPSHGIIGEVTREASKLTGIPAGAPVVAGGGDFPVSMLGFGIVGEGVTADVTGTSSLLAAHSEKPLIDPGIQNLRHVVDGWIPFTILDCGGISMKWCKDLINSVGNDLSYDDLINLAKQVRPGSDGLFFYSYMRGERRSENVNARGGYFGITLDHNAGHFIRAVMEGVALSIGKDVALFRKLGLDVGKILSVGGGTRNELWNEIKANVLRVPLEISDEPEAGIKGAALLAAAGTGMVDNLAEEAVARSTATRNINPDRATSEIYEKAQKEFNRIYEHMLGFWNCG
ncbi:MAG: FGGY family carbohydrate kinase [Phycisphaerae bacterium]|nr:FGGY family carbohydrate kinase [Phycisphaerae bacterium]